MFECVFLFFYILFCNIFVFLRLDGDVFDVFKNVFIFFVLSKLIFLFGEKEGLFFRNIFNEFDDLF